MLNVAFSHSYVKEEKSLHNSVVNYPKWWSFHLKLTYQHGHRASLSCQHSSKDSCQLIPIKFSCSCTMLHVASWVFPAPPNINKLNTWNFSGKHLQHPCISSISHWNPLQSSNVRRKIQVPHVSSADAWHRFWLATQVPQVPNPFGQLLGPSGLNWVKRCNQPDISEILPETWQISTCRALMMQRNLTTKAGPVPKWKVIYGPFLHIEINWNLNINNHDFGWSSSPNKYLDMFSRLVNIMFFSQSIARYC